MCPRGTLFGPEPKLIYEDTRQQAPQMQWSLAELAGVRAVAGLRPRPGSTTRTRTSAACGSSGEDLANKVERLSDDDAREGPVQRNRRCKRHLLDDRGVYRSAGKGARLLRLVLPVLRLS